MMMKESLMQFLKERRGLILYTILLTLICYGLALGNLAFGMDTNQYMSVPDDYLKHWVSIGRFGQVWLKELMGTDFTNIYLLNLLGIAFLSLSTLLICALFSHCLNHKISNLQLAVLPSLFATSPFFTTQFYFVLQIFEFMLSLFLTVLAVYLVATTQKYKIEWWKSALAACLLAFSCSIYLSMLLLFTALTATTLLLTIRQLHNEGKELSIAGLLRLAVPFMIVFLLGSGLYYLFDQIALQMTGVTDVDHTAGDRIWGKVPFLESLSSLMKSLIKISIWPKFWNFTPIYGPQLIIGVLLALPPLFNPKLLHSHSRLSYVLCLVVLLVSAFGVTLATGIIPTPRSMTPQFPIVLAILFFLAGLTLNGSVIKKIFMILIVFFTMNQISLTTKLMVSQQATFEEDQDRVSQLITLAQPVLANQEKSIGDYRLAIIGNGRARNKFAYSITGELIGISLFEFGWPDSSGPSRNVADLLMISGQPIKYPSPDSFNQLRDKYEKQAKDDGSMRVFIEGEYLVVLF